MAGAKEHAKRVAILVAIVGIIFSSAGLTLVLLLQSNNQDNSQSEQERLQQQIQEQLKQQQAACATGPIEDKKVDSLGIPENPTVESVPELKTEDVVVGDGQTIKEGDCVTLFYHGTLAKDGTAFTGGSNYADGIPYQSETTGFVPGFATGLVGMKVGGERRIYIPSAQGYGDQANGDIPANSDLIFTVRIEEVK